MKVKPLKKPIEIKFEQYECEACKKKMYINQEDKQGDFMICPFCSGKLKNIRLFDLQINRIEEY